MPDQTPTMWLQNAALWAGIFTLGFSVITYWIDYSFKKWKREKIKKSLNIEIRSIYHALRIDILNYDAAKTKNNFFNYNISQFNYPIIRWLIQSNELFNFFSAKNEISCLIQTHYFLSLLDKLIDGSGRPMSFGGDQHFQYCVGLRTNILGLAKTANFIDLSIMPKEYVGDILKKDIVDVEQYKKIQKAEDAIKNIIKKYLPKQHDDEIPNQFFGE